MNLKPCPCGKTPSQFYIGTAHPQKWTHATPDCCGEWEFEFRAQYEKDIDKLQERAADSWNALPRKGDNNE